MECDNLSFCHNPVIINEDNSAQRVICTQCKYQYVLRKDWRGVFENKEYSKIFRKETLQPHQNLFYKYYSQHLRT